MATYTLRLTEPERDFEQLAAWFTLLDDEPTSELDLQQNYRKNSERIFTRVVEGRDGELLGYYWATRDRLHPERIHFTLYVRPEQRGRGVGRQLYNNLLQVAVDWQTKSLRVNVWDNCPECRAFTERRGFIERSHMISMALDLASFDDRPYEEIIVRLKTAGFQFTTMEALGDSEEAQRNLYILNDTTAATTPGSDGEHSWASFEDFQKRVCQSDWYRPGGQIVAIDTATGTWAAMSAITRWEGCDYAYNLFTGVDVRYRGRKLGQAVKVLALRFGREMLQVSSVRTHHNARNLPMIAIDRKFGYFQLQGTFTMEKILS